MKCTYGNIVQFCQTTTCSANGTERVCLVEDQTVFILVLELDLEQKKKGRHEHQYDIPAARVN